MLKWFKKKPIKLCKDCRFFKPKREMCSNINVTMQNPINGKEIEIYVEPARIYRCGKKARYFEPKENAS